MVADPEAARSEWQAEFRSDISALLDDAVIEDAIDHARPLELPPRNNRRYHCFVDASAGRHDAFSCAIGHCEGNKGEETWVCDVIRGRLAPFDPRTTAEEYAALARSYGCTKIVGDAFAGEWVSAAFRDCGIRCEVSPLTKFALYLEALPGFNRSAVAIPNHERLLRELRGRERRVHRSGPQARQRRLCNALCGALYLAVHEMPKPKMRMGTIDPHGRVHWKDGEPEHPRVRYVVLTKQEDLSRRGLL